MNKLPNYSAVDVQQIFVSSTSMLCSKDQSHLRAHAITGLPN